MQHRLEDDIAIDLGAVIQTLNPRHHIICVHRGYAFMKLIDEFDEEDIENDLFTFHLVSPNGDIESMEDGAGVAREVFTEFWAEFYPRCCTGTASKVPCLRNDFTQEKWKAVGRILFAGWKQECFLPNQLAVPFLHYCLFNELKEEDLVSTFLSMIPEQEKQTLTLALDDLQIMDKVQLMDVLRKHGVTEMPRGDQLKGVIQQIAHLEIIQKPWYVISAWRSVLVDIGIPKEKFENILKELEPTNSKIVDILHAEESLAINENQSFTFLERYVTELSSESLKLFLRFATGAELMIVKRISVHFVTLTGLQRRPVAHTFALVLQIPSTYENFEDFRSEFDNALISKEWLMDNA